MVQGKQRNGYGRDPVRQRPWRRFGRPDRTPLIYEEGNAFGYRNAYRLVTLILLVVGILMLIFFRENPKGRADEKIEVQKKKARGQGWVGIEYSAAKKKGYFYAAAVCIFLTGMVLQGTGGVTAAHYKDIGIDTGYIVTVTSIASLVLTVSKLLAGVMYDRLGLRVTVTICAAASVIETIILPIYASDLFGEKSYNKILGIFVSINTAGYALGLS